MITDKCYNCGAPIKNDSSSTHIWLIEYECGCTIIGALDTETHGDDIDIYVDCPNK